MEGFSTGMLVSLTVYKIFSLLVGFGVIFTGYRLFRLGVYEKAGDLEAKLGEKHLILKQAAPGTFFVVLGSVIISVVIWKGLSLERHEPNGASEVGSAIGQSVSNEELNEEQRYKPNGIAEVGSAIGQSGSTETRRKIQRLRIRKDIAALNAIPDSLRADLSEDQQSNIGSDIKRIKLDLMEAVWASDWGDQVDFRQLLSQEDEDKVVDQLSTKQRDAYEYYQSR